MIETLSGRRLNRALLGRQLLLERSSAQLPGVLELVGGLQTQYAALGYIGLWSRLESFERDDLTRALESRTVIQATLMRLTIHIVSAADFWPLTSGIRRARRDYFAYGLAEHWLPSDREYGEEDGQDLLVERYLQAFGPSTAKHIADWAGVELPAVKQALERIELARFRDERGKELLDLPGASLPDQDTPAPVRFLPTWHASLLVHARRTQILPERYRPLVFTVETPHSIGTFLVDGHVAGTWRFEKGRVKTTTFAELPRAAARGLATEAERLAECHV